MSDLENKPPGHPNAVKNGCTCPVIDNNYGYGCGWMDAEGNPLFWFNYECPLHGGKNAKPIDGRSKCYPVEVK